MRRILLAALALVCLPASSVSAARVVAVGDIHGEIDGFDSVLRAARLIDAEGRWVGGDAILVQTGDVTDRGPRVRAVMDRLRALSRQAPDDGGRVVALLGNHEVSNLSHLFDESSTPAEVYHQTWADFAGADAEKRQKRAYRRWYRWQQTYPGCVKPENKGWIDNHAAWSEDHPPGFVEYIQAISPGGEYGAWLRGLEVAAEVDGSVFVHGGISPTLLKLGYGSVDEINAAARAAIEQYDSDRQRLIDEQVVLPFSSLWEVYCALYVEMARLEHNGEPRSMARWAQLAEINARLPGMVGWFPTEEHGPLWYRGLATAEEEELAAHVETMLSTFGARRIAVGHTPQPGEIRSRFAGRVFLIDTAMAYDELGGRPAALEIDSERITAIYPDERVLMPATPAAAPGDEAPGDEAAGDAPDDQPLEATNGHDQAPIEGTNGHGQEPLEDGSDPGQEPVAGAGEDAPDLAATSAGDPEAAAAEADPGDRQVWLGPDGEPLPFRTVEEVLDFLAKARVVEDHRIDTGITLPRKLLLERDGVRAHAVFHSVEIEKRREKLRSGRVVTFFRDHYANNVAAFELSRLLGMSNVPPAVIRRVGRRRGSVQLWIEGSRTEADRRRLGLEPEGDWRLTAKDMQVFDNLANNIDRNQGNILYDGNWNLWFIDHTRAFGRGKELPSPNRVRRCSRRLHEALRNLDAAEVEHRLRPYIGIFGVRGLMARRDQLLELLETRVDATSDLAVFFDYDEATVEAAAAEGDPEIPEAPPDGPTWID